MSFLETLLSTLASTNEAERETAAQALVALDADSDTPWLLHEGNAGSETYVNVNGQMVELAAYSAWWHQYYGNQYPLD